MNSFSFLPGLRNAIWFAFFNAVSFQIFLGPPMVLYAKSLGANATLLGVIASLTPLLTIFQIPAAHQIPKYGYRRFFLAGWGMRNVCVFGVTLIPLLWFANDHWKLGLLLGFQLIFNFFRGMVSGAWFPWITELVPDDFRARYLAREQRLMQAGCLVALLVSGVVLQRESTPNEYGIVFLLSALAGAGSLFFLNRVPDVHPHKLKQSGSPVPWREIVYYPPFLRLTAFNLIFLFTFGSIPVFAVSFLKTRAGFGENQILLFSAIGFLAGVLALPFLGELLDRVGSRKLLGWALTVLALVLAGWSAVAGRLIKPAAGVIIAFYAVGGIAGSAVSLANVRIQMSTMPAMGRSHFFAFFTVITSLCLGITPIFWGASIDLMADLKRTGGGFEWNRFSVYFASLLLTGLLTLAASAYLPETLSKENAGG